MDAEAHDDPVWRIQKRRFIKGTNWLRSHGLHTTRSIAQIFLVAFNVASGLNGSFASPCLVGVQVLCLCSN